MNVAGDRKEIFYTIHGSRLYGLNHEESDHDYYHVVLEGANSHRQFGRLDVRIINLNSFLEQCYRGVPQALEALFSPVKEWNPEYLNFRPFLEGVRISGGEAFETYRRTIKAFALHEEVNRRKHVVRLSLNLWDLMHFGCFNPQLSALEKRLVQENPEPDLEYLSNLAGVEIG